MDQAVLEMLREYDFRGTVQRLANRGYLQQNFRTVTVIVDHFFYRPDMPFDSGQPIDNLLLIAVMMFHTLHLL
jgi:hypothetical protein